MKLLADENCDASLVDALRADGHDIIYAIEELRGKTDDQVLNRAFSESRILITEDKDFGELVYRLHYPAQGIVLLRFDVQERLLKIPRIRYLLVNHSHRLTGAFTVLDAHKIRIRSLPK